MTTETFASPHTNEQARANMKAFPEKQIWWRTNGERQAWAAKNLHTLMPTVTVYRGGQVRGLKQNLNSDIDDFMVETPAGPTRYADFLVSDQSTVMSVVILHKGEIVFESYPRMEPQEKPIFWSVSKVLTSTLIGLLAERGQINIDEPIDNYIAELKGSSYEGVLIRNILDMATGLDCAEDYSTPGVCYMHFMEAIGEDYFDETSPDDPYEFMAKRKLESFAAQGVSFDYQSYNTNILGWLVSEVTGRPIQDVLTEEIWSKIGAEHDAAYVAPRYGYAQVGGGFLSTTRDLARFGLLFTPSFSVVSDQRIVSAEYLDDLLNNGNPSLLENARGRKIYGPLGHDLKFSHFQWDSIYKNNDMFKGGWAGQGLLVNPEKDLVAVYTGYYNDDQSEVNHYPILRSVLNGVFK